MVTKRIMIDFRSICDSTGFSTYLKMILKAIHSQDEIFYLLVNENAKNFNFSDYIDLKKIKLIFVKSKPFSLFSHAEVLFAILKNKIDVFHSTNFNIPIFIPKKCKLIVTIHDLALLKYKNFNKYNIVSQMYLDAMIKLSVKLSDKILTVSEYSKQDIVEYFKIAKDKIDVVYTGYEPFKSVERKVSINSEKNNTSLFFVGNNFIHKNIKTVIQSVGLLKDKGYNILFNIAGAESEYTQILRQEIKKLNLENQVKIWGKVTDDKLIDLYQMSDFFVFPSLVEGFGSPLLEAMNCGLPIISSNKTVMPEVVGDAGILIDPTAQNFANSIEYLINNPQIAANLITKGYARAKKFSQEKFTENILKEYRI